MKPRATASVYCSSARRKIPQHEQRALRILAERPVDGVIICASHLPSQDLIALHERQKVPMVVINRRIDHPDIPSIIVDFEKATYHATRHLLDLNHTKIAYLAGTGASDASLARRRGIELALGEARLTLRAEWCPTTSPNVEGGFQAMSGLLSQGPTARPTAVLAYNDVMALGALHAIRAHHLRVPDDISVVGFDDIAMAAHTNPPLTTIAQPKYRLGRLAMQMLRQMLRGDVLSGDGYTLLESPLIVREFDGFGGNGPSAGRGDASECPIERRGAALNAQPRVNMRPQSESETLSVVIQRRNP